MVISSNSWAFMIPTMLSYNQCKEVTSLEAMLGQFCLFLAKVCREVC